MKAILFIPILISIYATGFAQSKGDSVAYQAERKKINAMLSRRSARFGEYDRSLGIHTGIFGLQTKKDIRRSDNILMDIVKTDDSIYREIKILLDFRTFQKTQVQTHAKEAEDNTLGYMITINKLRDNAEKMRAEAKTQERDYNEMKRDFIIAVIVAVLAVLLWLRPKRKVKKKRPKRL